MDLDPRDNTLFHWAKGEGKDRGALFTVAFVAPHTVTSSRRHSIAL